MGIVGGPRGAAPRSLRCTRDAKPPLIGRSPLRWPLVNGSRASNPGQAAPVVVRFQRPVQRKCPIKSPARNEKAIPRRTRSDQASTTEAGRITSCERRTSARAGSIDSGSTSMGGTNARASPDTGGVRVGASGGSLGSGAGANRLDSSDGVRSGSRFSTGDAAGVLVGWLRHQCGGRRRRWLSRDALEHLGLDSQVFGSQLGNLGRNRPRDLRQERRDLWRARLGCPGIRRGRSSTPAPGCLIRFPFRRQLASRYLQLRLAAGTGHH